MNESIVLMVEEHENIRRMLKVVRSMCRGLLRGEEVNQEDFSAAIDFIRNYADHHHHKKEEDYLFKAMVENMGRIAENLVSHGMLVEHDLGRGHVLALGEALQRYRENPSDDNKLDIIAEAMGYAALLDRHIEKENTVVYPFAERSLSAEVFAEVNASSAAFEAGEAERAAREKYEKLLDTLEAKYQPAA
jgi:hemerythrin HHE cation binding domain protein